MRKSKLMVFIISVVVMSLLMVWDMPKVFDNINLGLDLQGGFEIVYEVSPLDGKSEIPEMSAVSKSISKRIDVLGVNEPSIMIEGENRIRVQLAGVQDQDQARRILSSTANMSFRDVNDNLLMDATVIKEGGATLAFQNGIPVVSLKIADQDKFYEVTKELATKGEGKNLIVTWLDFEEGVDSYAKELEKVANGEAPAYVSAASVREGINGDAVISGNFTDESARELADLINSGSLPVKMNELYSNVVSAELGEGAYEKTMIAGIIGYIAVVIFMIAMYRLPGVISAFMLFIYLWAVLKVYNLMGGVFTLPGIAALVMGAGMTVDANVITFERIKDELYKGRSVKKAFEEGSQMAFSSIFDSQFTTLIAALVMYWLGTGSVKGFATMLMITIVGTLLITVQVVKFLLGLLVSSGWLDNKKTWFGVSAKHLPDVAKGEERKYFGKFHNVDFMAIFKKVSLLPVAILVIAVAMGVFNSVSGNGFLNLGIDFASGTKITVQSDAPLTVDAIEDKFEEFGYKVSRVQLSGDNNEMASVSIKEVIETEDMYELKEALEAEYGYEPSDSVVTPVVGRELVRNALMACAVAWVAMLAYISFRFKFDYAISCIITLMHDVLLILAIYAIFRIEVESTLVAVVLSIIGYSINSSIVTFDRVREILDGKENAKNPKEYYKTVVNEALRNTGERSLITTITTALPLIALIFLGSPSITGFNTSMLVGILAGAFSSLFLAAPIWYTFRVNKKPTQKKQKNVKKLDEPTEINVPGINS
ncbi:MAG: protein translocase subunit SecD [Erysipelotrichales bacterium]|nr:protein translocase subunit SecD [Erysipelotrichales bacterium]